MLMDQPAASTPTPSARFASRHCGRWPHRWRTSCAVPPSAPGTPLGRSDPAVPSYVSEPGVDPRRNTETYASLTLQVDNPRWAGVPFTLRSGKALPTRRRSPFTSGPCPGTCSTSGPVSSRTCSGSGSPSPTCACRPPSTVPSAGGDTRARGHHHAPSPDGVRPPDPRDARQRPDALHPRGRGRGGLADRRPGDEGLVGRRRPDAGVCRRHEPAGTDRVTRWSACAPSPSRWRSPVQRWRGMPRRRH